MFHHRAVPIALAAILIDTVGFGIVLPVLPALVVRLGHVDLPAATRIGGYLLIAFAVAQFFAGPILGNLGDRFGRRPVLLAAMAAFSADYLLMAFAPTLAWLFVGRAVAGVTGAVYGPVNAAIADVTPPERRGQVFGYVGAAFGAGFILGPALGGLLSLWGERAPFFAASVLALVNAATIAAIMPETLAPEHRRAFEWRRANVIGAFAPLFRVRGALPLLASVLLWQIAHEVFPATWAFWAELALGWDGRAIGWSLAATGVVMMIGQAGLTGRVIARVGETRAAAVGIAAGVAVFALYAGVRHGWQVYPLILATGLIGLVFPSLNALLSARVDAANQGALQGGLASIAGLSAIVGPLAMTQALAFGSERGFAGAAFALAAALAAATLLVFLSGVGSGGRRPA